MKDLSNKNMLHIIKDDMSYLQFKKLLEYPEIAHAYTVGLDNNFRTFINSGITSNYETGISNYKVLCNYLDIDFNGCIRASLNHTSDIKIIDSNSNLPFFENDERRHDGIITNINGINLVTNSADCITLLLYDKEKGVIANIHSGWKGTYNRILENALRSMHEYYGCSYKDIMIFICPSIRECHFEVDSDVFEIFDKRFKKYPNIIRTRGNKWLIDTVLINKYMSLDLGVREDNIYDSEICTVCNKDEINSFRAHKANFGVNAAIIGMKGKVKCLKKN